MFKVKSSKHWISSWKTKMKDKEAELKELQSTLNETTRMYLSTQSQINHCCLCDDVCSEGFFAVETILLIPKDNSTQRFHYEVPRICCNSCSEHEMPQQNKDKENIDKSGGEVVGRIYEWWLKYQKQKDKEKKKNNTNNNVNANINSNTSTTAATTATGVNVISNTSNATATTTINATSTNANAVGGNNNNNNTNNSNEVNMHKDIENLSLKDRDNSAPLEDGFLICTQLVKTGGADQGGLQVGDVLVEFGHYSKARFPGLKSIATLVRRSAGKEIPVVVWRKLENLDSASQAMYQRLSLKVTPLQSHDANGGGVLGAVINTYPLPQTRV